MHHTESLFDYCTNYDRTDLIRAWHPVKNDGLTPKNVTAKASTYVWWQCEEGHEWQASVYNRTERNSGCPYCSGHRVLTGKNDLATTHPDLAAEWHPTRNKKLTPQEVSAKSRRKVWWQCEKGHEWQAALFSRSNGCGCPVCCNRVILPGYNDLATTHPALAAQWHPTLNGKLTPEMVTSGSTRRVWWICSEGHVWRTAVYNRAGINKQTGCPVCAGNVRMGYRQKYYAECIERQKKTENIDVKV